MSSMSWRRSSSTTRRRVSAESGVSAAETTSTNPTRVVCHQLAPRIGDLAANHAASLAAVGDAVSRGADIVVLPELVTSGYLFRSRDEAREVAITPDHPIFGEWAATLSGDTVVVGGFCELGRDGSLYNSAAVVDRSGVVAVYRKTHLWDRENLIFEAGDAPPPVVDTPHGRLGVIICYDLEFPELTRCVALRGADLLTVPTNWPLMPRPAGERPGEIVLAMAAARVNRVFIACCDRVGSERGQEWTGGTSIIDEAGWVLAASDKAGAVQTDVDLRRARAKSLTERNDLFGDRRPGLYGDLVD